MFRERDESGSLPLHIAVSGSGLLRCETGSRENLAEDVVHEQNDDHREVAAQDVDVDMGEVGDRHERNDQPLRDDGRPMPQQEDPVLHEGEDDHEDPDGDESDISESDMEEDNNECSSSVSCGMEIIKLLLEQHPSSIRLYDTQTRSLPLHLALKHNPNATEAIDHFMQLYPKSAIMPDGEGRLPIHIALLHNSPSWERVLEIAPNTLEKKDPVTGLLPFQLAALPYSTKNKKGTCEEDASSSSQELASLTTCFRLLRMNPHLASGLAEAPASDTHPAEQRVAKLEAENNRLRERVRELENHLMQFQLLMQASNNENALKKRKSFTSMDILRSRDGF
jgi:TolA-binding protein